MKTIKSIKCGIIVLGMVVLSQVGHSAVVFDNLGSPLGLFNTSSGQQVGDEIVLAGGAATITNFKIEYFGSNFVSGESAQVSIYKNDGAPSAGYASPGTLLWDSGAFSIPGTFNASLHTNAVISFDATGLPNDLPSGGLAVPGDFTWAVVFTGIGAGSSAGTILSSAKPTTGSDYNDYWLNAGTVAAPNWQLMTNSTYSIDFLAQASTVPEPSSFNLFVLGFIGFTGLACLAFKRRAMRA